jgi:ABC-type transporter Mla MlaB component
VFGKKNKQEKQSTEDWVTFDENGENPTLRLSGELGFFTLPSLEEALWKFIASHKKRKNTPLEVDLSAVSAIADSRIISVFIQAYRGAEERKMQLRFLRANSAVRHAFESVNASEMLSAE